MKILKIFILLLVLTTGIAKAQFTKAELQVSGLTCALCAKATEKALRTLPFIGEIKTDLIRNTYLLTFKSGEQVNFDQISKKVQDAGFFVNSLKATFDFANVKVADNSFSYGGDTFHVMAGADKVSPGPTVVTIVDKGFAPKSVSKKYMGQVADVGTAKGRVYHVAI
ncbi:heavy-metal-associated domain-containing protein [Mucilaginibacter sp. BJC16-A38]|uniref:heavy-metal-associated domain-containing protein n=1 Tax=Mucilaginibacter phenanthrenivorans TaxID=1234842 RepID=UPI0021584FAB|nr:heavy-metal-associated domain-containing protein [Mucilaginibacter phenanthrenivorans]MCR8560908.1 heavy-metal-associated domain-containing protein [Mucilaginibacter phenanthrenivorans]